MAQTNYEAYRLGTKDGEIKFGHLSEDGQVYSCYLNNYFTDQQHYIAMVQTGQSDWQANSTLCRSTGSFTVKAGDAAKEGTPGIDLTAESGDIIINAKNGRIKLIADNIDLIASGTDGANGNIRLTSNEKITLDAGQMIDIHAKVSCKIVSDKTVEMIGKSVCNIVSRGSLDLIEGADIACSSFGKGRKGGSARELQESTSMIG